jgi:hypothetical protein
MQYTRDQLLSLRNNDVTPCRLARKAIFSLKLWLPAYQRRWRVQGELRSAAAVVGRAKPVSSRHLRFGLLNVRSARNKIASIHALLSHEDLDVLALTETWVCPDDPDAVKLDIAPSGYGVHHVPRPEGRGGGLAVVYRRDAITVTPSTVPLNITEFELQLVKLSSPDKTIDLAIIYRQPGAVTTVFCDELSDLMDLMLTSGRSFILCGDFNCPGAVSGLDPVLADVLFVTT